VFTGLVEGLGTIILVEKQGKDVRLGLRPNFIFADPIMGESVAINGICLTLEKWEKLEKQEGNVLYFFASAETLSCSTLGALRQGQEVNMERALQVGSRLGGHMLSGHVDCVAEVLQVRTEGASIKFRIHFPSEWAAYVVSKGSVALDGVSLTINTCTRDSLDVNIIPESQKVTNILSWKQGTRINMETDIVGKYILRAKELEKGSGLSVDFLKENGFA